MKKNIAFILGITILSGSILTISFASRNAYHSYLISKQHSNKSYRNFSTGRSTQVQKSLAQKRAKKLRYRVRINRSKNLRYTQSNTRNTYSNRNKQTNLRLRPSTGALSSNGWNNPLHREAIVARNIDGQSVNVQTYENKTFSVQLPLGWTPDENHVFRNEDHSFLVRVKRFNTDTCNDIQGFASCAITLGKNENRIAVEGRGTLTASSKIVRQSHKSDTILNQPEIQTRTFTESFASYEKGFGEVFINRYFVKDLDGGVYLIETKAPLWFTDESVAASKAIFDSFRIYPRN